MPKNSPEKPISEVQLDRILRFLETKFQGIFTPFLDDVKRLVMDRNPDLKQEVFETDKWISNDKPKTLYLTICTDKTDPKNVKEQLSNILGILEILKTKHGLYFLNTVIDHALYLEIITMTDAQTMDLTLEAGSDAIRNEDEGETDDDEDDSPEIFGLGRAPAVIQGIVFDIDDILSSETTKPIQINVTYIDNQDLSDHKKALEDRIELIKWRRSFYNSSNQKSQKPSKTLDWLDEMRERIDNVVPVWLIEITVDVEDVNALLELHKNVDIELTESLPVTVRWAIGSIHKFERQTKNGRLRTYCSLNISISDSKFLDH